MRPIRAVRAACAAPFESLGTLLSSHRAVTRVSLAALSFTILIAFNQHTSTQAGPEQAPLIPESLLPQNVGLAVATDQSVTIPFDVAMDPASVESAIEILPAQPIELSWNDDRTQLTVAPERLWHTDQRYLLIVSEPSTTQAGAAVRGAHRFSFTTERAPAVIDFQVRLATADLPEVEIAAPTDPSVRTLIVDTIDRTPARKPGAHRPTTTAQDVSATSPISISFSDEMDRADVERHFGISPEVTGDLSWSDGNLVFTPTERLEPGTRYTISVIGSHDATGNLLGGKGNFSFVVQAAAQLITTSPKLGERGVEPATVEMRFSAPMDVDATNEAFVLTDTTTGAPVSGRLNWNEAGTQLSYTPDRPFADGRTFAVELRDGATDADGNAVSTKWSFTTPAAPVAPAPQEAPAANPAPAAPAAPAPRPAAPPAPVVAAPAPSSSLVGHALNQINAARAAYGFAPLVLDAGITAVASAHAWDQVRNGYYSHTSRNGMSVHQRLAAGGVSFGAASENQCHYYGQSAQATLNWCHSVFMSEPYPGHWNHIANILNPKWRRVGVGIADNGSRVVITWNFTN